MMSRRTRQFLGGDFVYLPVTIVGLIVAYWLNTNHPALLYSLIALFFVWRSVSWWLAHQKRVEEAIRARRLCLHCGYDLRATPERCPECGQPATPPDGA